MKQRVKAFVLGVLKLADKIPQTVVGRVFTSQLVRSATSVGSNYRAVCRSRSDAEFMAKLSITLEETDETEYWLDMLIDSELLPGTPTEDCRAEARELLAIFVSSRKTMEARLRNKIQARPQSSIVNRQSSI